MGADHFNEDGILSGQNYRRTTIRNNNNYKLFNNKVRLTQNLSFSTTNSNNKPLGAFDTAHRQSPAVPVKFDDGKWGLPYWSDVTGQVGYIGSNGQLNSHGNPIASVYYTNDVSKTNTLQGMLQADVDVLKDLTFTSRVGATKYWYNQEIFSPIKDTWLAADPTRTEAQFLASQAQNPTNKIWKT